MSDDELYLWARITVLQAFIQYALVSQMRREGDRKAALEAAKQALKEQAIRVHLPGQFPVELRDKLSTVIRQSVDQMLDDIADQLG